MTLSLTPEQRAIMESWALALESGEFKQGTGRLRAVDREGFVRHCCLGVLTELAHRAGVQPERSFHDCRHVAHESHTVFCDRNDMLSTRVAEWAGLADSDPDLTLTVVDNGSARSATDLNDGLKATFQEIAYRIRRKFLGAPIQQGMIPDVRPSRREDD